MYRNINDDLCCLPGCRGRKEGRIQNSGGIGLLPIHSNTPSIYKTIEIEHTLYKLSSNPETS